MSQGFEEMRLPAGNWGGIDIDVANYDTEYVVMADLPGFDREHIDLRLDEDLLTIRAERHHETDEDSGAYLQRERRSETLSRRVRLPEAIDVDGSTATYTNGVLTVTVPKLEPTEDEGGHRIDID